MKAAIASILGAIIIVLMVMLGATKASYQKEIADWQNRYARSVDSLIVITAGKDSALMQMTEKVGNISVENEAVKASLHSTNAKVRYWADIAASYKKELNIYQNNATIDTVFVNESGDSTQARYFNAKFDAVSIIGNFDKYAPWDIRFEGVYIDSIGFNIGIAEAKDGSWRTYLTDVTPGFTLGKISALAVPYKPAWYEHLHVDAEINSNGGGLGAGYGPWTGMYYLDKSIGVAYSYTPFKR